MVQQTNHGPTQDTSLQWGMRTGHVEASSNMYLLLKLEKWQSNVMNCNCMIDLSHYNSHFPPPPPLRFCRLSNYPRNLEIHCHESEPVLPFCKPNSSRPARRTHTRQLPPHDGRIDGPSIPSYSHNDYVHATDAWRPASTRTKP